MRKHKSIVLVLAIVLAIATAVSGATFAWFTAADNVVNRMQTGSFSGGDVQIVETFDPSDPLTPGVEVNKDVSAINVSGTDVTAFVRISFAEALTLAAHDGQPVGIDSLYTAGALASGQLPQLFNTDAYVDATGAPKTGWELFTATASGTSGNAYDGITYKEGYTAAGAAISATPNEITILVKKGIGASGNANYTFVAFAKLPHFTDDTTDELYKYNDKYQRVEPFYGVDTATAAQGNFNTDGWSDVILPGTGAHDKTLYVGGWKYFVFEKGASADEGKWTSVINGTTDGAWAGLTSVPVGSNDHLTAGGYTSFTNTFRALPNTASNNWGQTPPTPAPAARLAAESTIDANLMLLFAENQLVDIATLSSQAAIDAAKGKWFYNPADGFFYYIGKLAPGQTSDPLLDGVYLKQDATSRYSNLTYDLNVCMQAIQAEEAALAMAGPGGWGLSATLATYLANVA
ncbi:MAG: hypothetical protein LBG83_02810 [Oscillospiraceae bacterium]|jgi:hypothetical protein|nr:hypothetical protein [Oscillospiraceae bacterium]